jgi:zinc transport system substrate-binding protein
MTTTGVLVKKSLTVFFSLLALGLAACTASETAPNTSAAPSAPAAESEVTKLKVLASFYPLAYVAEQILGDIAEVTTIAAGSTDPHDLELTPSQVTAIVSSDFAIYIPEFMPAFDASLSDLNSEQLIDATIGLTLLAGSHDDHGHEEEEDESEHEEESENDPHVWLNPLNMIAMGANIVNQVSKVYPDLSQQLSDNLAEFTLQMNELDSSFKSALVNCEINTLLVSHEAFGYLANQYGFEQTGLSGLSPEAEPSPARLAELVKVAKEVSATTIYYETTIDPKVALTLAAEVGLATAVLDPIEIKPAQGDYRYAMEENLKALTLGQGCKP